jgi:hypothetical protein
LGLKKLLEQQNIIVLGEVAKRWRTGVVSQVAAIFLTHF